MKGLNLMRKGMWLVVLFLSIGTSACHGAAAKGDFVSLCEKGSPEEISEAIKNGADVNVVDEYGRTPLIALAGQDRPEIVSMLIKAGADINYKDPRGNTVLHHAAHTVNNLEFIQTLLDHGADPKAKNGGGATPLMAAASTSDENTVSFFLSLGLPVDEKDDQGFTAFMHAAMCNESPSQVLKVLMAAGADVDATDDEGRTALMRVSENPYAPERVKTLLELGAKATTRDDSGRTALDYAISSGQTEEVLRMLGKKPAPEYAPMNYRKAAFEEYPRGTRLYVMGEVSRIMGKNVLINTRRDPCFGYIQDPVYVKIGKRVRALTQDLFAVNGTYQGLVDMEDAFGNTVSIPCVKADEYEARKRNLLDDMQDDLMDDFRKIFQ